MRERSCCDAGDARVGRRAPENHHGRPKARRQRRRFGEPDARARRQNFRRPRRAQSERLAQQVREEPDEPLRGSLLDPESLRELAEGLAAPADLAGTRLATKLWKLHCSCR